MLVAAGDQHGSPVWIEKYLCRIESHAGGRIVWTVHSEPVDLAGLQTMQEQMPIVECAVSYRIKLDNARRPRVVSVIEQQKIDTSGVARVQAEVYAAVTYVSTQRIGSAIRRSGAVHTIG